ncbi:Uma2 family endonuclease [Chthonobacter rhizosphaerae]|uniref:Uma2 family endonuclease n=1 Tax=Chthonobacter rhizosphaerae TaxID=2735553 RepID=UPI0015EE9A2F|nr:Uma2 family endonuclease [Chthonobacter rhizosphaerae]
MEPVKRMRMTPEEFLLWDLDQPDGRHELVDGVPRPQHPPEDDAPRGMTGARRRHDRIVVNLVAELRNRLRGSGCVTSTADTGVRIPNGNLRRPDVAVDCGRFRPDDLELDAPSLIVEVLSRSTRTADQQEKRGDYRLLPSLEVYVLVHQESPRLTVYRRLSGGSWVEEEIIGLDSVLGLPGLAVVIPLADIYEGVALET